MDNSLTYNDISVNFDTVGMQELLQKLSKVKDPEKLMQVRRGMSKAGGIIKDGEKRRLKERMKNPRGVTGNLVKSMKVKVARKRVLVGFARPTGNHSHLVDRGHNIVVGKNRVVVGTSKALHFREDTQKEDTGKALNVIKDSITVAVNDQWK